MIRRGNKCECETLNNIAVNSEAYWGYDSTFMENFKSLYKISEELISDNKTYVIEENGNVIGFYIILIASNVAALEYFYIAPDYIGKGYGKLLWHHMVDICRKNCVNHIVLVTSPQAKEFYIRMGAAQIDEVDSLVMKGRKIPKLIYIIEKD